MKTPLSTSSSARVTLLSWASAERVLSQVYVMGIRACVLMIRFALTLRCAFWNSRVLAAPLVGGAIHGIFFFFQNCGQ